MCLHTTLCVFQVDGESEVRITAILGRRGTMRGGGSSNSGAHRVDISAQGVTVDSRCMRTLDSFVQARGMNYDTWWFPQVPQRVRRVEACGICSLAARDMERCEQGKVGACVNDSRAMLHWLVLFHGANGEDAPAAVVQELATQSPSADRPSTAGNAASSGALFPEVVIP